MHFQKVGMTPGYSVPLDGWQGLTRRQLVNSRAPEIVIYSRTYLRASFHRSGVNRLRARSSLILHEQTRIAETRLHDGGDSQYHRGQWINFKR